MMERKCIVCASTKLEKLKTTKFEVFVTGDRKKFDRTGYYLERRICMNCGTVQFDQNQDYQKATREIYKNYEIMHDKMWSADDKENKPRLQAEYERIAKTLQLPKTGNMLDLGCGGGESLFQFNRLYPEWNLYGMDIGEHFAESVTEVRSVKAFFSSLKEVENTGVKFDLITINNTLSLADNPAQILKCVHNCLAEDGIFVIKDADFEVHPWILYELESSAFYTQRHMENIIKKFGFEALHLDFELEPKEIGVFCKKSSILQKMEENAYALNRMIYDSKIGYLDNVIDTVGEYMKRNRNVGIWGTSIAGVWLSEIITSQGLVCSGTNIFYIDEDEDSLQRKMGENGYPIYRPEEVLEPAVVFLPFPRYIADHIKEKCEKRYTNLKLIVFE